MKKMIVAVVLMVALLSGCSVSINSKDSTPSPSALTSEQAYIQNLRSVVPQETDGVPDAELIQTGEASCGALDRGVTFDEIATETYEQGLDPNLAGAVIGAAVKDLCPDHQGELDAYLDSQP